ncbi:sigma-54 factor, Activator interacting domain family protein [Acinetobacter baumannii 1051830]|nr:sigma-54 factor, Activator interacting domain family protein [Acinetobacter baumannii 1051830]
MKLSVGLKVANSLSLTPQLQQAIRLLQLSSLELEQEIQIQLDSNPLLEKVEDE